MKRLLGRKNAKRRILIGGGATVVVLCAGLFTFGGCRGFVKDRDYQEFKAALGDTTMTVFPAIVRVGSTSEFDEEAAASVARMLAEQSIAKAVTRMDQVELTNGWHINQARMLKESSADLSSHLATHPVETDYAMLPEYLGNSREFGGIQCNIVRKDGTPAFALVMNSHHKEFSNVSPKTASECTEVLLEGLKKHLGNQK